MLVNVRFLDGAGNLLQQIPCSSLTNTLTWTMMNNAWLSGTETNLISTSWFIQHLQHLLSVPAASSAVEQVF